MMILAQHLVDQEPLVARDHDASAETRGVDALPAAERGTDPQERDRERGRLVEVRLDLTEQSGVEMTAVVAIGSRGTAHVVSVLSAQRGRAVGLPYAMRAVRAPQHEERERRPVTVVMDEDRIVLSAQRVEGVMFREVIVRSGGCEDVRTDLLASELTELTSGRLQVLDEAQDLRAVDGISVDKVVSSAGSRTSIRIAITCIVRTCRTLLIKVRPKASQLVAEDRDAHRDAHQDERREEAQCEATTVDRVIAAGQGVLADRVPGRTPVRPLGIIEIFGGLGQVARKRDAPTSRVRNYRHSSGDSRLMRTATRVPLR
jgi:hypothetical protein